jgi:hypothetical protein
VRQKVRFVVLTAVVVATAALVAPGAGAKQALEKTALVPTGAGDGDGVTTPGGGSRYTTLYGDGRETTLLKIDTDGGTIDRQRYLHGSWQLPAVTISGAAGGLSADGKTLVLVRPAYGSFTGPTEFTVLGAKRLRTRDSFSLPGAYGFDAISPDGGRMYLVQYRDPRDPLDYAIRAFDLDRGQLDPGEVVDPSEPDERMAGQPVSRQMSPDGRWAYTLYGGGKETFIHALDTEQATAVCVDLAQFDPGDAFRLRLDVDPSSGAITVLDHGTPTSTVDPATFDVADVQAEPVSAPEPVDRDAGSDSGWVGPVALGCGIALLAAACLLVLRRNRRATV